MPPQKLAQRGHKEHSRCVHENIDARGNGKPKPSSVEEPFNRAAALLSDSLYQLLVRATACDHAIGNVSTIENSISKRPVVPVRGLQASILR